MSGAKGLCRASVDPRSFKQRQKHRDIPHNRSKRQILRSFRIFASSFNQMIWIYPSFERFYGFSIYGTKATPTPGFWETLKSRLAVDSLGEMVSRFSDKENGCLEFCGPSFLRSSPVGLFVNHPWRDVECCYICRTLMLKRPASVKAFW